jgi:VWFA-related protein
MNADVRRGCFVTGVALAVLLTSGASPVSTQGQNKSIFVSVLDGDGKPVTGLNASDFAIREDNVDRTIVDVKPASQPIYITMLVDTTTGAGDFISDIRDGFTGFVKQVLSVRPDSQLALWEFGQAAVRMQDFTNDLAQLTEQTRRIIPKPNASSVLLEAIHDTSEALAKKPSPRRAIVILNLEPSQEESRQEPNKIRDSLMKSRAQLWAVSLQKGTLKNAQRDVVLNNLVRNAGGTREYIVAQTAVPMQLARIADALTSQYEITYERPSGNATIVQVGQRTGRNLKLVAGIAAPK